MKHRRCAIVAIVLVAIVCMVVYIHKSSSLSKSYIPKPTADHQDNIVIPPNMATNQVMDEIHLLNDPIIHPVNSGKATAPQGFMLAVDLCQQATGGFLAFSQLGKFARILNLTMVEPYISDTRVNGVPRFGKDHSPKGVVPLSTLYDLASLQNTLKSCCYMNQFDKFETMMIRASRNVVYVCFLTNKSNYKFGAKRILEVSPGALSEYCMYFFQHLNKWMSYISSDVVAQFQLAHVFVVDARSTYPFYLSHITKVLSRTVREEVSKNGSATVIFAEWRGIHTKPSDYFYYVPDFPSCNVYTVNHSETVIQTAKQLTLSLSEIHPVIGVHIRGERLLLTSTAGKSYPTNCLRQLKNTLITLTNSTNASSVHIIHDLGDYGSVSCQHNSLCRGRRVKFKSQIEELGYPIANFDPTKFNMDFVNPTFVSFVEREYLSQVDILVTVGRGAYQQSIVERFQDRKTNNRNSMLLRMCSQEGAIY